MQAVTTIGLDIAKSVFQVHGVDAAGQVLIRRQFALDRAESLSAAIAEDGQTIRTRTSVRVHPGLRDELANRALVARLLSKLGINVEPVKSVGRPASPLGWMPPTA